MHDEFADWYRMATAGTDTPLQPEHLLRRWEGVEAVVEDLGPGQELELVRILLRLDTANTTFRDKFWGIFKKVDPTLPSQKETLELSVLAGSALVELLELEGSEEQGDRAALGLVCRAQILTADERPWCRPFFEKAVAYLDERSRNLRRRVELPRPGFDSASVQAALKEFVDALPSGDWGGQVSAKAQKAFNSLTGSLQTFADSTTDMFEALTTELSLRREESEILWWMTGEFSRDLDKKLSDVKLPAACILAGKELADLVTPPGPLPAQSFLDRILSSCGAKGAHRKPFRLDEAVNSAPLEWRRIVSRMPGLEASRDLCPVLGAVHYSLSTRAPEGWLPIYRDAYALEPGNAWNGVELAYRCYRECLLCQACAKL